MPHAYLARFRSAVGEILANKVLVDHDYRNDSVFHVFDICVDGSHAKPAACFDSMLAGVAVIRRASAPALWMLLVFRRAIAGRPL